MGAEEYIIRAAAEGSEPDPLIDLSQIDFDALAAQFAGRKRAETDRLAALLQQRAIGAATRNPTRYDLVERIEELIAEYNAGSLNIDEYLRRLIALSQSLTERGAASRHRRAHRGGAGDLRPAHQARTRRSADADRELVKASAKRLLAHLHDKLVLDWRRKAETAADVRVIHPLTCSTQDLPADPYPPDVFDAKVQAVFDHVASAYGDDGQSVYDGDAHAAGRAGGGRRGRGRTTGDHRVDDQRAWSSGSGRDADFAALGRPAARACRRDAALRTIDELIANDEDYAVEFKSTARWDLRESQAQQGDGGRRRQDRRRVPQHRRRHPADRRRTGSGHRADSTTTTSTCKPTNGDGFVNWLTTHLINAFGHTPVTRARARIVRHDNCEVCRVDVAASPTPVWAKTSKAAHVFFVRFNNSTRVVPDDEVDDYTADHWPAP